MAPAHSCHTELRPEFAGLPAGIGGDGDFSWELFEKSYNADLANNLGNLVNRVTSMAHRYRGGVLRSPGRPPELSEAARQGAEDYEAAMTRFNLSGGAAAAMAQAADAVAPPSCSSR